MVGGWPILLVDLSIAIGPWIQLQYEFTNGLRLIRVLHGTEESFLQNSNIFFVKIY
jgi:hypothetical protein